MKQVLPHVWNVPTAEATPHTIPPGALRRWVERVHGAVIPPAVHARPRSSAESERILIIAFELMAGLYAGFAAATAGLTIADRLPRSMAETGPGIHVCYAMTAAALAVLGAVLHKMPRDDGGHLWSLRLGWLHWGAMNLGFLGPAALFHFSRTWTQVDWTAVLAVSAGLMALALAALAANLIESMLLDDAVAGAGGRERAGPLE